MANNVAYPVIVPDLIRQELAEVESMLPSHIPFDKFVNCFKIIMLQGGKIMEAEKNSVISALSRCAADGLMPDSKEAVILPFNCKVNNQWMTKAQYLPMVDGILKRARMSGEVNNISGKAVYENDHFKYWIDKDGEQFQYRPHLGAGRGAITGVFAYAQLKNGCMIAEYMSLEDINKVRAASKTSAYGPWADWFDRMAIKSILHRLCRRIPNASELVLMCEQGTNMRFDKSPEAQDIVDYYPNDKFLVNLPTYTKLVARGAKTGHDLIQYLETKQPLSKEQQDTLLALKALPQTLPNLEP